MERDEATNGRIGVGGAYRYFVIQNLSTMISGSPAEFHRNCRDSAIHIYIDYTIFP